MDIISVIIPVYNIETYLVSCLDSVLNQTYKELEVILVDDGSTDSSGNICDEYAQKDSRVIVFHKQNGGVSSARNLGIIKATGEYVSFIDGDDIIAPEMYELLYKNMKSYSADISSCGIAQRQIDGNLTTFADSSLKVFDKHELIKGFFDNAIIKETMYGPCHKLFKTHFLKQYTFNENYAIGEDLLFMFECIENSSKIVLDNRPMYFYLKRPGSATTSLFSEKRLHYIFVADILLKRCEENYPFAYISALKWSYVHKLTILRKLNRYRSIRKKYIDFYNKNILFIRENQNKVWSYLSLRRKFDFYLLKYVPFIYKYIL